MTIVKCEGWYTLLSCHYYSLLQHVFPKAELILLIVNTILIFKVPSIPEPPVKRHNIRIRNTRSPRDD